MFRARYAPQLSRRFRALDGGMFGDFGRFSSILGDFSVGVLPKHTWMPGSWVGTEHYLKSALVGGARIKGCVAHVKGVCRVFLCIRHGSS
jgi:hypothetical protein